MSRPHQIGTRVSDETLKMIQDIEKDFGPNASVIANMALEDYCPRYIAAKGKPASLSSEHTELLLKISDALVAERGLKTELDQFLRARLRKAKAAA